MVHQCFSEAYLSGFGELVTDQSRQVTLAGCGCPLPWSLHVRTVCARFSTLLLLCVTDFPSRWR
jgi:hypothetical protein